MCIAIGREPSTHTSIVRSYFPFFWNEKIIKRIIVALCTTVASGPAHRTYTYITMYRSLYLYFYSAICTWWWYIALYKCMGKRSNNIHSLWQTCDVYKQHFHRFLPSSSCVCFECVLIYIRNDSSHQLFSLHIQLSYRSMRFGKNEGAWKCTHTHTQWNHIGAFMQAIAKR